MPCSCFFSRANGQPVGLMEIPRIRRGGSARKFRDKRTAPTIYWDRFLEGMALFTCFKDTYLQSALYLKKSPVL